MAEVRRCLSPLVLLLWPAGLLMAAAAAEQVAVVEVYPVEQRLGGTLLRGEVVAASAEGRNEEPHHLEGELVLIQGEEPGMSAGEGDGVTKEAELWIGVLPVDDSQVSTGKQESFTETVVSRMDLSQALCKPVIVIQTSENVTRLISALLRGLQVTAKITFTTVLHDNLVSVAISNPRSDHVTGCVCVCVCVCVRARAHACAHWGQGATLTLWSSCGRSRGGRYGEWQGVICTGETNSQVQKYLQQLWDTVLLVALILSTGVIVQARWQYQDRQLNDNSEVELWPLWCLRLSAQRRPKPHGLLQLLPKQDILKTMLSLKTKTYRRPKRWCETDTCAVCLEAFNNNQCLRVLPCRHEYHRDCVDPWLLLHHTCPLCKRSILAEMVM
ncbi:RING finger protein 215 isoform X3 [Dunckerocampus dactyliophorus]|uniref:RING finger protein 215 isoform X3 n=1 Tax=Dunckerocampus dactyliophorus TaxID=161453 RepID=UPI002404FD13|nr:RING finger protein 215 isoform X3 [Dunckerocampus dactyliophorus]